MSIVSYYSYYQSPLGKLLLKGTDDALTSLDFVSEVSTVPDARYQHSEKQFSEVKSQLDLYFAGKLKQFSVAMDLQGTSFQLQVWRGLSRIPHGVVISYKQLAERIGNPKAVRAVGSANGRNPIPIIIPCHRVIAADGTLGGYSSGLAIKKALLSLEKVKVLELHRR